MDLRQEKFKIIAGKSPITSEFHQNPSTGKKLNEGMNFDRNKRRKELYHAQNLLISYQ